MAGNIPHITLTEPQRTWLRALCSKLRSGQLGSARTLKVELRDKLPRDFDPSQIDYRLLAHEDQITLLGIALLDPSNILVKRADLVINSIHDLLIRTPEVKSIDVDLVSQHTNLPREEVAVIFRKLSRVGYFHDSGTIYGYGIDGLLTINIDSRTFDAYLKNESLKELIDTLIHDESRLGPSTDLSPADQLYDRVKSLIEKPELNEDEARIVVESTDDALKEFGSTNQEKKVELRKWKAKAESVLPPATVEELRKRAEAQLLRRSYPRNPTLRKFALALVALTIIAGALLTATGNLSKLTALFSRSSKTSQVSNQLTAVIEVTNSGTASVKVDEFCEFYLTEDRGMIIQEYPKGRALLSTIDPSETTDQFVLNAGQSRLYRLALPNVGAYNQLLERGAANIHFLVRVVDSKKFAMGSIEFQRDALSTYRVSVKINEQ